MSVFDATMICEGVTPADEHTQLAAWQLLIDLGVVWQLQGAFGRMAHALIADGLCEPGDRERGAKALASRA